MMPEWKPISLARLKEIIFDTAKDNPDGDYCADEVYRLAREVQKLRSEKRKRRKDEDA